MLRHPEDQPADWLAEALPGGGRLGFDPWLHTAREIEALAEALGPAADRARRASANLVDAAWPDQPPPPAGPIVPHPAALAGRDSADKRGEIARGLVERDLAAAVLTLPDSIAWLLNVRGSDIARTPVPLAFAILHADARVALFTDPAQGRRRAARPSRPRRHGRPARGLRAGARRARAGGWRSTRPARRPGSPTGSPRPRGAEVVWERDPCILPKATKTEAEIAGARAAHLRDGAAMAEFLAWLDLTAPEGGLTEIDVVRKLEEIRAATGELRDISFETICGAGPNGAIVHYRVTEASNRQVAPGELLLVDSGAQYADGTTDITRTVAVGPAPAGRGPAVHAGAEGPDRHVPAPLAGGARRAATSTRWRAPRSGGRASTTTTAPATASAPISACTRGRRACRGAGSSRSCRA